MTTSVMDQVVAKARPHVRDELIRRALGMFEEAYADYPYVREMAERYVEIDGVADSIVAKAICMSDFQIQRWFVSGECTVDELYDFDQGNTEALERYVDHSANDITHVFGQIEEFAQPTDLELTKSTNRVQ